MPNMQITAKRANQFFTPPAYDQPHIYRQIEEIIDGVTRVVSKVWPLKDYVAINPYDGMTDRTFADASAFLRVFSDCELLMPLEYFRAQHADGRLTAQDVRQAISESQRDGLSLNLSTEQVMDRLRAGVGVESLSRQGESSRNKRPIRTIAEYADQLAEYGWQEIIVDELSKFCAAHYDQFESTWASPWKDLPVYQAWRSASIHDRNPELLGLTGFRKFVASLPHTPTAALVNLLSRLQIPTPLWESFLLCQVFSIPGWCAWAKYQDDRDTMAAAENLVGLLAARTAYDVALAEATGLSVRWDAMIDERSATFRPPPGSADDDHAIRMLLLRAVEINHRNGILNRLSTEAPTTATRKLAQMVFCIDVRSERMRRNLESHSAEIETYGFAGFFGMPIEYVRLGDSHGDGNVPALIEPSFKLHEGVADGHCHREAQINDARRRERLWQTLWRSFQKSAFGCFSFVETTGLMYSSKLVASTLSGLDRFRSDTTRPAAEGSTGPSLHRLECQGWTLSRRADLAESMLRNLSLTDGFARLVVFCGHASATKNNPLSAGLDCGACGGHSGEPNARFAALLLNQADIRAALAQRGVEIPTDTVFLAALHNTTTDEVQFFDVDTVPVSHQGDVEELVEYARSASTSVRSERIRAEGNANESALLHRATDWSEVRPEWGLAGNAAFLIGPRWMTKDANLEGRMFLHSYDHATDEDGIVLENIMTAPMIVAHWINMQYYASTVDNRHFGSGDKTIHNVVGGFGILSGGGGDLMTGLPTQSIHDGKQFQHTPMRLQVIIAATRQSVDRITEKHASVKELVDNQWMHLTVIEGGKAYRLTRSQWCEIESDGLRTEAVTRHGKCALSG